MFQCKTIHNQRILLPWIWNTAKHSYQCLLKYKHKELLCLKGVARNSFVCLCYGEKIKCLTSIETFSCLGGLEITHETAESKVSVRFPIMTRSFMSDYRFIFLFGCPIMFISLSSGRKLHQRLLLAHLWPIIALE